MGEKYTINRCPVTNKYKSIVQLIDDQTGSIEYSFGNELDYFAKTFDSNFSPDNAIQDFNAQFNVPGRDITTTDFYKFSSKYKQINYEETVFPRQEHQYKGATRQRDDYVSFWFNDDVDVRIESIVTSSQGYGFTGSSWSMDVDNSGSIEKSGELMRNTGSTGVGRNQDPDATARYSFTLGETRPYNLVQLQAGTGAFYNTYGEFAKDVRLIGQDQSLIPEFTISDFVKDIFETHNGDFLKETVYNFSLTGTENLVGNSFEERYGRTEQVTYLKQLKDFYGEPTSIKITFDATLIVTGKQKL